MRKPFVWKDEDLTGVEEIDAQHRELLNFINRAANCVWEGITHNQCSLLFDEIQDVLREHYATEERCFKQYGALRTEGHIKAHAAFERAIAALARESGRCDGRRALKLIDVLVEEWRSHLREDVAVWRDLAGTS